VLVSEYASGPADTSKRLGDLKKVEYKEATDFFSSQANSACYPGCIQISGLVRRGSVDGQIEK
jgi:hypothetical protein